MQIYFFFFLYLFFRKKYAKLNFYVDMNSHALPAYNPTTAVLRTPMSYSDDKSTYLHLIIRPVSN